MPVKLTIGLSRKIGDANYGSRGASVNVELEAEASLVNEPAKLHEKIRQLFNLVRSSVTDELNGSPAPTSSNGNGSGHAPPGRIRPATQSQVKALHAIAKANGLQLQSFLRERFQVSKPEDLNIKQASEAIDRMKTPEN